METIHPSTPAPSAPPPRPRRRRKILLLGLLVAVASLLGLLALAPTILSSAAVRSRIEAAAESSLGTEVEIGRASFSWFGAQEIGGLRVSSPGEGPDRDDLLVVPRAVLHAGLFRLLTRGTEGLRLEIEKPELNIRRDAGGRFNFEGIGRSRGAGSPPVAPEAAEGGGPEDGPPRPLAKVQLSLRDGIVRYRDEVASVGSTIVDFRVIVEAEGFEGRGETGGTIVPDHGDSGFFEVSANVRGLGGAAAKPSFDATGVVRNVDLRPLEALLEKAAGMRAPESPLNGKIVAASGSDGVRVEGDLDVGFGRIDRLRASVSPAAAGKPATVEIPVAIDLKPALAVFRALDRAAPGTEASGRIEGVLSVSAPVSLEEIRTGGLEGKRLAVALEGKAVGLDLALPPRDRDDGTEAAGIALSQKDLSFAARLSTGAPPGSLVLEDLTLRGDGISTSLSGEIGPIPDRGEEAGEAPAPRRLRVEIRSLELGSPQLIAALRSRLPEGLVLDDASRLSVSGWSVEGEVGGEKPPLETLRGAGKAEVSGTARFSGLEVSSLSTGIRLGDGEVALEGFESRVNGGTLSAETLALGLAEPRTFRVSLSAEAVDANYDMAPALAWALPFLTPGLEQADLSGKIRAKLELEGRGFQLADLRRELRGAGSLRIVDGRVRALTFFESLASVLNTDLDRMLFAEIGSDFDVGSGAVVSKGLFVRSKEGGKLRSLQLAGKTLLDGTIDYGVTLSGLREAVGGRGGRRVLDVLGKVLDQDALPLKLSGTLRSPRLAIDPSLGLATGGLGDLLKDAIPGLGAPEGKAKPDGEAASGDTPDAKPAPPSTEEKIERGVREVFDILDRLRK